MKILFVADVGSPIARQWMRFFIDRGDQVTAISSYPVDPSILAGATVRHIPTVLTGPRHHPLATTDAPTSHSPLGQATRLLQQSDTLRGSVEQARYWASPIALRRHDRTLNRVIAREKPDLVHALRLPYEGILAAQAVPRAVPLIASIWGNDLTLHAHRSPVLRWQTRATLRRADGLLADCQRDLRLAARFGFDDDRPACVLPGNGGVRIDLFRPGSDGTEALRQELAIPPDAPVVLNPRGIRGYVRQDVFFRAIPKMLRSHPGVYIVCVGMESSRLAQQAVRSLDIGHAVRLLPSVPLDRMAALFRLADVSVSLAEHDGTPNSLLEAMASGSFPVAGDLDSIREWIESGRNGLLCEPGDADAVAHAIRLALDQPDLRRSAADFNRALVLERAEYEASMARAAAFYDQVVQQHGARLESA